MTIDTNTERAKLDSLCDRLRGIYHIPITDGMGATGGGDEPDNPMSFVRRFPSPPIQQEAADEIDRLRGALTDATKPDAFWFAEDPEFPLECWSEAVEDFNSSAIVEVMCGKSLPNRWVATICLTVDENGDPAETDTRLFDNLDEAKRCWPESLAAARAALKGEISE